MDVTASLLSPSDWIPNNRTLPVLFYKSAVISKEASAKRFEILFQEHGWTGLWRDGIFSYQHYHVHAHEVLGVADGHASIMIGGTRGIDFAVTAGDCLILPAGTGHCLVAASQSFLVVGAYPPGQSADIKTSAATGMEMDVIRKLSLPTLDPVTGTREPLLSHWRSEKTQ